MIGDKTKSLSSQRVGFESGKPMVIGPSRISTCASKRIEWSSYWKWMTSARMISAQHPKNERVVIWTTGLPK